MTHIRIYRLFLPLLFSWSSATSQQHLVDSLHKTLQQHPSPDTIRLTALTDLAWALRTVDAAQGLSIADSAIGLARTLGDLSREASALNTKAWNYSSLGRDADAIPVFRKALDIRAMLHDSTGIARIRYNIGIMYFNRSDYPKALEYQQSALDYFIAHQDLPRTANAYNAIGLTYQYVSDYPKALDCYLNTLAIYEKLGGNPAMANTLTNIGILYKNMGTLDKAIEYHNKALDIYTKEDDQQGMSNALGNIGIVYDEQHQPQKALGYYNKALIICRNIGFRSGLASNLNNAGSAYAALGDNEKAIDTLQAALGIWKDIGDKNNETEALSELAKVYTKAAPDILKRRGIDPATRYAKANQLLQQALTLAREIKSPSRQQAVWENLAEISESQKDWPQALHAYRQAVLFRDSVTNIERAKEMTKRELQFDFEKRQTLAAASLNRQILVRNSILAGLSLVILACLTIFIFYKKRTDAEYRADIAVTEMKALRAQMNPHFIFNSLNSISDFIARNDTASADLYLSGFARLMRLILENSEWTEITLAEDLHALEIYMQLENLRLDQRFTYDIRIAPGIDKDNLLVPPLILQPFVENAIWHGISAKPGGHILVGIDTLGDSLQCIVEDNGPGIKGSSINATGINATGIDGSSINTTGINDPGIKFPGANGNSIHSDSKNHRSLGQKITSSRIDLLNQTKNTNASVSITSPPQGGTRVELLLPITPRF